MICGCGTQTKDDIGLTGFGIEYVKKLEEKSILVDISHTSEKTFWNVIENTKNTIIATHSNVYELCNHPRNLKDEQIKEIAKRKGIIGICLYSEFLNSNGKASVKDVVRHMKYIKNLVGIDYVGLGTDYDGISFEETAEGVEDVSKLNNIIKEMKNQCFSDEEIVKVMWKNWYRVLKNVL